MCSMGPLTMTPLHPHRRRRVTSRDHVGTRVTVDIGTTPRPGKVLALWPPRHDDESWSATVAVNGRNRPILTEWLLESID